MQTNDSLAHSKSKDLITTLSEVIRDSRKKAFHAINTIQVQTCWLIGRHIIEFEQGGMDRAEYGKGIINHVAESLTMEFGKGFDERNLRNMRAFYLAFPKWNALRSELSWTHYRLLLRVPSAEARDWYATETAQQGWSTRTLERQIGTLYYERLLTSNGNEKSLDAGEQVETKDFIRDPVILEFLGLPNSGKTLESTLEQALIDNLQGFLLELGKGFAFIGRQVRISTETKDFYIDLVFYNYILKCFVLFDLKSNELTHQDIGQMDMYVRLFDETRRRKDDGPTVGIILCSHKDRSIVRYSILHENDQLFATTYRLVLPTEEELRLELQRHQERIADQFNADNDRN
jgi:predicted nuclease of restriction endonuclease-like (RecB) superfamily